MFPLPFANMKCLSRVAWRKLGEPFHVLTLAGVGEAVVCVATFLTSGMLATAGVGVTFWAAWCPGGVDSSGGSRRSEAGWLGLGSGVVVVF